MLTTLKAIKQYEPCVGGWRKLLRGLGKSKADDEPLSIVTILDINGLDDALWCLQAVDGQERRIRLYAVDCVRQVKHLMKDPCSLAALDVVEKGSVTRGAARAARWAAEWAARAAEGDAEGDARAAARDAARKRQADKLREICGQASELESLEANTLKPDTAR